MARLIQLPTGTYVAPDAIRLVEARSLGRPYVDHEGAEWPAMVCIETRNQVVRVPCATFAEAVRLRDCIGGTVNAHDAQRERARIAPDGRTLPASLVGRPGVATPVLAEAS